MHDERQTLPRALLRVDVGCRADPPVAVAIPHAHGAAEEPAVAAVLRGPQTKLDLERFSRGDRVIPALPHLAGVVGMHRAIEARLASVFGRHAGVVDPALVE